MEVEIVLIVQEERLIYSRSISPILENSSGRVLPLPQLDFFSIFQKGQKIQWGQGQDARLELS